MCFNLADAEESRKPQLGAYESPWEAENLFKELSRFYKREDYRNEILTCQKEKDTEFSVSHYVLIYIYVHII